MVKVINPVVLSQAILKHHTWWLVGVCCATSFILCIIFWGLMDFILKESKTATLKIQYLKKKYQEELEEEEKENMSCSTSLISETPSVTKEKMRNFKPTESVKSQK